MLPPILHMQNRKAIWTPKSESSLTFLVDWNSTMYKETTRTNLATADGDAVASWTDQIGGRNVRAITDAQAPKLIATAGPGGRRALQFDATLGTPTGPLYFATGSQILSNQPFTMGVVYQNLGPAIGDDGLMGRGGNVNAGTILKTDVLDRTAGQINAGSLHNFVLLDNSIDPPNWRAAVISYDGANARRSAKIATNSPQGSNNALTGALSFNAADTAFWIGGVTSDGSTFTWCGTKKMALAFVMTRVPASNAELQEICINLQRYAGILP